jgi:hypothetical protein
MFANAKLGGPTTSAGAAAPGSALGGQIDGIGTAQIGQRNNLSLPADLIATGGLLAGLGFTAVNASYRADRVVADIGITPEAIFDTFSTARSAPGVVYWVDIAAGSDSNDGLSAGAAKQSISAAITAANANAAATARLNVKGRPMLLSSTHYNRTYGFAGGSGTVTATKDMSFFAYTDPASPGDVWVQQIDNTFPTLTDDGSGTATWTGTVSSVDCVVFAAGQPDAHGNLPLLRKVGSQASCQKTPGSWALVGSTFYVHMPNGTQPLRANCWIIRPSPGFYLGANVNIYFGSEDGTKFVFAGGNDANNNGGALKIAPTTLGATRKVVVGTNLDMRYAFRGVSAESFHGYVLTFNDTAGAIITDYLNSHNLNFGGAAKCVVLAINPIAKGLGMENSGFASCNMVTAHDTATTFCGVIGGSLKESAGGMVRSIGLSRNLALATVLDTDLGDLWLSSNVRPTLFGMYENAVGWIGECVLRGPLSQIALSADPAATVKSRNVDTSGFRNVGVRSDW